MMHLLAIFVPFAPFVVKKKQVRGTTTKKIKVKDQHENFLLRGSNKANPLGPHSVFAKRLVKSSREQEDPEGGGRRVFVHLRQVLICRKNRK